MDFFALGAIARIKKDHYLIKIDKLIDWRGKNELSRGLLNYFFCLCLKKKYVKIDCKKGDITMSALSTIGELKLHKPSFTDSTESIRNSLLSLENPSNDSRYREILVYCLTAFSVDKATSLSKHHFNQTLFPTLICLGLITLFLSKKFSKKDSSQHKRQSPLLNVTNPYKSTPTCTKWGQIDSLSSTTKQTLIAYLAGFVLSGIYYGCAHIKHLQPLLSSRFIVPILASTAIAPIAEWFFATKESAQKSKASLKKDVDQLLAEARVQQYENVTTIDMEPIIPLKDSQFVKNNQQLNSIDYWNSTDNVVFNNVYTVGELLSDRSLGNNEFKQISLFLATNPIQLVKVFCNLTWEKASYIAKKWTTLNILPPIPKQYHHNQTTKEGSAYQRWSFAKDHICKHFCDPFKLDLNLASASKDNSENEDNDKDFW